MFEIVKRPWGWMVTLFRTKTLWVKILRVRGQTSYQSHEQRTEYHLGLSCIKPRVKHRMARGWFLEIATGVPDENDIIRYEDDYGR